MVAIRHHIPKKRGSDISSPFNRATELVQLLIERGAGPQARTDNGETALSFAEKGSFSNTAVYIREQMTKPLNAG